MRSRALVAFLGLGLGSCLIIPEVPHYMDQFPSRENMDVPLEEGFPVVGTTTREEVLSRLGAPDEVSANGSRLSYRWRKVVGELLVWNSGTYLTEEYGLEIECDGRGRVVRAERR